MIETNKSSGQVQYDNLLYSTYRIISEIADKENLTSLTGEERLTVHQNCVNQSTDIRLVGKYQARQLQKNLTRKEKSALSFSY